MLEAKKFFQYVRKSTKGEDKQSTSLKQQDDVLIELAQRREITVSADFEEEQSAKLPGRPVFNEMMTRIEAGEADGLLVYHPNRLARNPIDAGRLIFALDQGHLKQIITPHGEYGRNSAHYTVLNMMLGQAHTYSVDLSNVVVRGMRAKLEAGLWPTRPKLGYVRDQRTGRLVKDPDRWQFVKRVFEMRLQAHPVSVSEITRKARYEWGLCTPHNRSVGGRPLGVEGGEKGTT